MIAIKRRQFVYRWHVVGMNVDAKLVMKQNMFKKMAQPVPNVIRIIVWISQTVFFWTEPATTLNTAQCANATNLLLIWGNTRFQKDSDVTVTCYVCVSLTFERKLLIWCGYFFWIQVKQDVDHCCLGIDACHPSAKCVNDGSVDKGYRCQCTENREIMVADGVSCLKSVALPFSGMKRDDHSFCESCLRQDTCYFDSMWKICR